MKNWIINIAVVVGLLSRELFPTFLQAHYFECAACLYLTFMIGLLGIGILLSSCLSVVEKKKWFPQQKASLLAEFRNMIVSLAAIFAGHYIIGVAFLISTLIFNQLLEEYVNEQVSRNVSTRRIRTRR